MKSKNEKYICMIPLMLLFVIVPLIVKVKIYENPLIDYSWYSYEDVLADFFLYYKSMFITMTGVIMLVLLGWQISKMRRKETLISADTRIFVPIIVYTALVILSSLFSEYGYFCTHGMPDQFETVWNLLAYVIAVFYCYYLVVYHQSENMMFTLIYVGAMLVGLVCLSQFLKKDIYRWVYSGEGYSFTFDEGVVYGPFYNINYVGFYVLLFIPLILAITFIYKDIRVRAISAILLAMLLIALVGAKSITGEISLVGVSVFAILFLMFKKMKSKKSCIVCILLLIVACIGVSVAVWPRMKGYLQTLDNVKTDLESIYTRDEYVEINYKGEQLLIQMVPASDVLIFRVTDQNQNEITTKYATADEGYYYYEIDDKRFENITLTPATLDDEGAKYGFMVMIDGKPWNFSNQLTDDGTYYYYTATGKLTKLTEENISDDFGPLKKLSGLASGRGYIWNKTIALLKDYILIGSGADTFAVVFPNDDVVDKSNHNCDNLIFSKPHNLYLQIAVQTGVLSLICYLIFYAWYFFSSLRIYYNRKLDTPLSVTGFAIMLGTLGYMISGLANDSSVTVAPLFWALMGIGIGINHRLKVEQ